MSTPKSRVAVTVLTLSAALAMSGCSDNQQGENGVEASVEASTTPQQTATEPSATPSVSAVPSPSPSPSQASSDEPNVPAEDPVSATDCLPGNWYLDNEGFATVLTLEDTAAENAVTGVLMMTFHDDGTVDTLYEDWTFTYSGSGDATVRRNGTDYGTYNIAADGTVSLADTTLDSTTMLVQSVDASMLFVKLFGCRVF